MAQVVVTQKPPVQGTMQSLQGIVNFFATNWGWLLAIVVIIILAIVIIVLMNKMEDKRKERDEPGYQLYKTVKMAADLNKDPSLIRKNFNPATLPLILLPVFGWLLMALLKKEHSSKVVDYQGNLIGYYRGDYVSQDNTWNFLVYKDKWLLFFEKTFIIKAPLGFELKKLARDTRGDLIYEKDSKTPKVNISFLDLRNLIQRLPNHDYKIMCTGVEPIGMYYKCPVYIIPETGQHVDYRKQIEGAIIDNTYQLMVTRLLNTAAKQMEKGMMFSPDLQFKKMAPVKTKEEGEIDKYE